MGSSILEKPPRIPRSPPRVQIAQSISPTIRRSRSASPNEIQQAAYDYEREQNQDQDYPDLDPGFQDRLSFE